MARSLARRLILTGTLRAIDPLHVGSADDGLEVDMPLSMNGQGRYYIPGTSLTGALREWARGHVGDEDGPTSLWGGIQWGSDVGSASRIIVDDAVARGDPVPEVWHGNGIDRQYGVAATRVKYERMVLPRGTQFSFCVRLDASNDAMADEGRALLWHLKTALERREIGIGAGSTRGLARVELLEAQCREQDWTSRTGVLAVLRRESDGADKELWSQAAAVRPVNSRTLTVRVHWQPKGPLMVMAGQDGLAVDMLPLMSADGAKLRLVLPGSSIKGVLRAQAERIVRTVLGLGAEGWESVRVGERHLAQLDAPIVTDLFGHARGKKIKKGGESAVSLDSGARGWLGIGSCYSSNVAIDRNDWDWLASAKGGESADIHGTFGQRLGQRIPGFEQAFHVAVDRWTAAPVDGALYSAIEPYGVEWEPIELRLRLGREGSDGVTDEVAATLLFAVMRDWCEGWLKFGFGANRGYGTVEVSMIEWQWQDESGQTRVVQSKQSADDRFDFGEIGDRLETWKRAWSQWMDQQTSGA